MGSPGAEHADHVPAADVDQVLGEEVRRQVVLDPAGALVAADEGHVAGLAAGGEPPTPHALRTQQSHTWKPDLAAIVSQKTGGSERSSLRLNMP